MYAGIDPGKEGAIALLDSNGNFVELADYSEALGFLEKHKNDIKFVYLERVHSMPKQGVSSTFNFGENYGWWQGVLQGLKIPFETKPPQEWQKGFDIKKSKSDAKPSLEIARKTFPKAPLNLKKHHNRADALLIAYKCWQDRS